jgi:hypothetical protein
MDKQVKKLEPLPVEHAVQLSNDMEWLINNQTSSDIVFKINDTQLIYAHRAILGCRR